MTATKKYSEAQIEQMIKDYILKEFMYDRPDVVLPNDLPLLEECIIDSMGIVRLIRFLEEQFDFTVNRKEMILDNLKTVNAIKSFVISRL